MHKKICIFVYPSTYDIRVQMLLPKHLLVHIRDEDGELILLPYVSTLLVAYVISGMTNISGGDWTLYKI